MYALLDPFWRRAPLPVRGVAREVRVGPLPALEMYRSFAGRPLMKVYAYALGEALVNTGLASLGREVLAWTRARGLGAAIVTHHHEDHAGNAALLLREGVAVQATEATAALMAADLPIPFYEHLAWGHAPPARPARLPEGLRLDGDRVEVVPAPGHCVDQVCFWMPDRGWLFSGDVFLHEKVRLFRRDEDFAASIATLERLCALGVQSLFCAHRPRVEDGGGALRAKLQHLRELEGRVRALHAKGWSERAITRAVQPGGRAMELLTFGDSSTYNLVWSILHGPRPRRELARLGFGRSA